MNDPFDALRDNLVAAARSRPVWRRGRRGLLALLGASVLAGGGVATAVVVRDEPSRPARGTVPTTGEQYSIELRPDLTAGAIGWCASLSLRRERSGAAGSGCGPAAPPGRPQIIGIGMVGPREGVLGMVVDERVAVVELPGGRRIVPRADPGVPAPWKLAIATVRGEPGPDIRFFDARGRRLQDDDPPGGWGRGRSSPAGAQGRRGGPAGPAVRAAHRPPGPFPRRLGHLALALPERAAPGRRTGAVELLDHGLLSRPAPAARRGAGRSCRPREARAAAPGHGRRAGARRGRLHG
ncbi:hypothetical protein DVA67_000350 [Solirubrobacter sp. CPCC 204708]|nr:hypothetical protein [Solirubrobacter deserti]